MAIYLKRETYKCLSNIQGLGYILYPLFSPGDHMSINKIAKENDIYLVKNNMLINYCDPVTFTSIDYQNKTITFKYTAQNSEIVIPYVNIVQHDHSDSYGGNLPGTYSLYIKSKEVTAVDTTEPEPEPTAAEQEENREKKGGKRKQKSKKRSTRRVRKSKTLKKKSRKTRRR